MTIEKRFVTQIDSAVGKESSAFSIHTVVEILWILWNCKHCL